MTTATVRYITNGFTVNWQGSQAIGVPASLYAAQLPEAVYWLGRIFDPVAQPAAPPAAAREGATQAQQDVEKRASYFSGWKEKLSKPEISQRVVENEDPLLGQQAQVIDIASGGFLVSQLPATPTGSMKIIETYCVDMDAVHGQLNIIFAPPAPTPAPTPSPTP